VRQTIDRLARPLAPLGELADHHLTNRARLSNDQTLSNGVGGMLDPDRLEIGASAVTGSGDLDERRGQPIDVQGEAMGCQFLDLCPACSPRLELRQRGVPVEAQIDPIPLRQEEGHGLSECLHEA
jgi:hypothetical protein